MSEPLRMLCSPREQEQAEISQARTQTAVDQVDEHWPDIRAAAAYVKDCKLALIQEGFSEDVAHMLLPVMLQHLWRV
jgi:hypothetical protein